MLSRLKKILPKKKFVKGNQAFIKFPFYLINYNKNQDKLILINLYFKTEASTKMQEFFKNIALEPLLICRIAHIPISLGQQTVSSRFSKARII